jgi:hypothetical protein
MRIQNRLCLFGMECHRLPFPMSELEVRANPHAFVLSRDRKNLRLTGEKCTGQVGGWPTQFNANTHQRMTLVRPPSADSNGGWATLPHCRNMSLRFSTQQLICSLDCCNVCGSWWRALRNCSHRSGEEGSRAHPRAAGRRVGPSGAQANTSQPFSNRLNDRHSCRSRMSVSCVLNRLDQP